MEECEVLVTVVVPLKARADDVTDDSSHHIDHRSFLLLFVLVGCLRMIARHRSKKVQRWTFLG